MSATRLRRELLRLATALMEAAWFWAAWAVAFGLFSPQSVSPSLALVSLLMITAVFVARYLDLGRAGSLGQAVAVAVTVAVLMFVVAAALGLGGPGAFLVGLRDFLDPNLLFIVGYLALWWRGISLVGGGFSADQTGFRFRVGVVVFMWVLMAAAFAGVSVTSAVFVFFTAGLLAMGLARVEDVSRDAAGVATPFDRGWVSILVGAVIAVMLLGLVISVLFSVDTIRAILGWMGPLWDVLARVLVVLLTILAFLLSPLVEALARALRPALDRLAAQQLPTPTPGDQEVTQATSLLPEAVGMGLKWALLAIGLLAAVMLLGLWAQRRRAAAAEPVAELRESVWSAEAFAQDARSLWERAVGRFRRHPRGQASDSVRHIYATLQAVAAEHGAPRPADDTPYEYLPMLVAAFPTAEGDLLFLTETYVDAHYHELPTSDATLAQAQQAWARIRQVIEATPRIVEAAPA